MAAAKTFETSFRIGAKYTGAAEVGKARRDIDKTEGSVRRLRDSLHRARKHFFDFGKVAAGAFAGFTAANLLGSAIRRTKDLGLAAFNAADDVIKLREENKRLLQSFGMSAKEAEATEKRLYGVAQAMQAAADGGHDAELMSKALVGLRKSLDEKTIIAHKDAIAGYATLLADGAIPTIEHFQQVHEDMNNAVLLGKSPMFKALGWTKTHIKVFKESSKAERQRILLMEMERKGWNKLTQEFYKTDTGRMVYAMTVWGDLLENLGGESAKQKGKIADMLIDLAKNLEPISKELGKIMGLKLERWLKDLNQNMPEYIRNLQNWSKANSEVLEKIALLGPPAANALNTLNASVGSLGERLGRQIFGAEQHKRMQEFFQMSAEDMLKWWNDGIARLQRIWDATVRWFDENVIQKIAWLWDWLIGNSYMVEGTERGWQKIKEIWSLWADWFWVHVVNPIAGMWGGLTKTGFLGGGGHFRGHGATGSWGSGGGAGVTGAGGGALGSTGPNAEIAAERAAVMAELQDPTTRRLVAATLAQEMGSTSGRADVLESLVNRAVVKKQSLRRLITNGFYGPYNSGQVNRALRRGMSPAAMEEFDRIAADVAAGRNRVKGRVDQGRTREVAARGRIFSEGEAYGFWNMARESNTAAFRAGQLTTETKMVKQQPKKSSTPYSPINPYPGMPGLRGPAILSPGASLRDMTRGMRGRTGGQSPTSIAMNSPITIHGVSADRAGAIGDEVVRAMQDPARRMIAEMKRARSTEQRLNFDFA